VLLAAPFKF